MERASTHILYHKCGAAIFELTTLAGNTRRVVIGKSEEQIEDALLNDDRWAGYAVRYNTNRCNYCGALLDEEPLLTEYEVRKLKEGSSENEE